MRTMRGSLRETHAEDAETQQHLKFPLCVTLSKADEPQTSPAQ